MLYVLRKDQKEYLTLMWHKERKLFTAAQTPVQSKTFCLGKTSMVSGRAGAPKDPAPLLIHWLMLCCGTLQCLMSSAPGLGWLEDTSRLSKNCFYEAR